MILADNGHYGRLTRNYGEVLGGKDPQISKLDAIVTSVGGFEQTHKFWTKELTIGGVSKDEQTQKSRSR